MDTIWTQYLIRKARNLYGLGFLNGGGGGIRTHGTRERSTVFKTAPINRSGTPPNSFSDTSYFTCSKFFVNIYFKLSSRTCLCALEIISFNSGCASKHALLNLRSNTVSYSVKALPFERFENIYLSLAPRILFSET